MKTLLRSSMVPVLMLLVGGCRANLNRELLERELLAHENEIYHLQDMVDECGARLDSCHRENEALLAELGRNRTRTGTAGARPSGDEELAPPLVEPGSEGPALPYDGPPVISPPDPHVPEGEHLTKTASAGPKSRPGRRGKASTPGQIDEVVTQITLNRKLTGGHNVDDHPGDEGVMVVVEPLNAAGDLVEVPGTVSIVVLDPALEGNAARVARWDFTREEAADHIKRTPMGDGLHFDLRWPHSPPEHRVLNLYARYTTADGRRLQVEKQIEVDPPGGQDAPDRVTKDEPSGKKLSGSDDAKSDAIKVQAKTLRSTSSPDGDGVGNTARRAGAPPSAQRRGPTWAPYR